MRILTFCFSVLYIASFSQGQKPYGEFSNPSTEKTEKKILKVARKAFDYGNYSAAIEKYAELLKLDSTNPMYNFEQAQTLYNNYRQPQSIPYFEKAILYSKDSIGEAYYFLGISYHLSGQFDKAQDNYKVYLGMLNNHGTDLIAEEEKELKAEVKHRIEMCENGKMISKSAPADKLTLNGKTRPFRIENMGNDINSEYDDYGEVLSANDSILYFTSRKEGTTGDQVDWDDKFFEDIYMSNLGNSGWEKCVQLGAPINSKKHEAVISISDDGKTIYFYRGVKQGTFYYSTLTGNVWSKPEILFKDQDVNTNSWETSFFGFSVAGNELYVVSDRDGGIGVRDIYVSKKQQDGSWGALKNIGGTINTPYDEDAPFITSNGKTMYFSSKGHNSMGGFDIFRSERQGDSWSEPVNMGLPFNTPGEDIYFIVANKTDCAFYSSSSLATDSTKDMDIYTINLCDDIPEIILAGRTSGITNGSISIAERSSGQKVADVRIENGQYSVRLKHGADYRFTLNYPSVIDPVSADISIPTLCKVYDLYQEISFDKPGQPVVFKNAFFNIKKETAKAGISNYTEFLNKLDKNTSLYSEISVPTSVILAKVDTQKIKPVSTLTTSVTSATTTISAATQTVTTTEMTTDATTATTTGTHTVTTSEATTTATTTTTTATGGTTTVTTISVNNVLFDYDKSTLNLDFTAELDKVVDFLKETKNAKINIAGYTDSKGSDEYNLALSKRRADAVMIYLASKGVSRNRIKTAGNGKAKPIAPNENPDGSDNPDGRAKNRRTEITVVY
jgi:outer membrane protein OmpA-like peptidoglycan-associated protein/tetratricopeptide (TPR) repeat protein